MKIFNYFLILIVSLIFTLDVQGQIPLNIETNVMQPYPTQYSIWASESESFTVFVTNDSDTNFKFFLRVELMGTDYNNEDIFARISEDYFPSDGFELEGGASMLYTSSDIADLYSNLGTGDVEYSDNLPVDDINGELPAGEYRICIQAFEYIDGGIANPVPVSPVNCSEYFAAGQASVELLGPDEFLPLNTDRENVFMWNINGIDFNDADLFEYQLDIYQIDSLQATEESVYDLVEEGSAVPFFTSEPVNELIFIHDPTLGNFPMNPNDTYAAQVTVVNANGLYIENNNKSNIMVYGTQPEEDITPLTDSLLSENQVDCFENCHYTLDNNVTPLTEDDPEQIQVGNFTMTDIEISSHNNDKYSGTGKIEIQWLNNILIKVNFNNITVNSDGRMITGDVKADKSTMPDFLDEAVNLINTTRLVGGVLGAQASIDLPIGIDQSIAGMNLTVAITELNFTPTECRASTECNFHIPAFGDDSWISLETTDICMHPGGFGNEFIMNMGPDRPINSHGDVAINFKGSQSNDPSIVKEDACYLEMDCNGVKSISLKADVFFPESMILPEDSEGIAKDTSVKGTLEFTFDVTKDELEDVYAVMGQVDEDAPKDGGIHFIASMDVETFQIKNVPGWGFTIDEMFIDASELASIPGIIMPEDHEDVLDGELSNTWTGFYLKKGQMALPQELLGAGGRFSLDINHMIIDPKLSVNIAAQDLFPINDGNIDGWGLSMDSLFMSINQNHLTEGGFSGQLRFPLAKENQHLRYTATIGESSNEEDENNEESDNQESLAYTFNVSVDSTLTFPFMISEVYLAEDSYIEGGINAGDAYFESFITGGINMDTKLFSTAEEYEDVAFQDFKLPFIDFRFKYHSDDGFSDTYFGLVDDGSETNESEIDFSGMGYGIEQRKESLVGLPISLKNISFGEDNGNPIVTIEPVVSLSPGETSFGADAIINIHSNFTLDNLSASSIKTLKLSGFDIEAMSIDIFRMGMGFSGSLHVYDDQDDNGVGTKGVKGDLNVALPLGAGLKMAADFGSTTIDPKAEWDTKDNYPYWYFDGMIYFGENGGIPIAGPVGLYGIGGGVQYNMTRNESQDSAAVAASLALINVDDQIANGNDIDASQLRRTGETPVPSFGTYGLKMAGTLGTCPSAAALNMDVSILAEFTSGDNIALSLLEIEGDAFLMTPLGQRHNPQVWAGISLSYSNPSPEEYAFNGQVIAYANVAPFGISLLRGAGPGRIVGDVDFHASKSFKKSEWWLHVGSPDSRCGLELGFEDILEVSADGYFMLGHNLPTTLPVPEDVAFLFGESNSKGGNKLESETINGEENRSTTSINNAKSGKGLAFGAETGVDIDIDKLGIYASLKVYLGFDINITKNEGLFCSNTGSEIGINGWYGQAQIYGGLEGSLGFRVRALGKDHDLELFGLKAAMMLSGGGPNPFYADGRVGLQIRVLGGLIKCSKTISMEVGEKCIPEYGNPFGGVPIIAETFPSDDDVEVSHFAMPKVTFSLPMDEITEITIIKPNGNIGPYYVEPYYENVKLINQDGNEIDIKETKLIKNGKMLKIYPKNSFKSLKSYSVEMTIKAKEYPNGPDGNYNLVRDQGSVWRLDTVFTFTVAAEVDLNDGIEFAIPMRGQKYFLQDEVNTGTKIINFTSRETSVFKQDNVSYTYDYYVRYICENGDEPIEIPIDDPVSTDDLDWDLPNFLNNKHYCMQLIRKKTAVGMLAMIVNNDFGRILQDFEFSDSINKVRSLDTLDLGKAINPVEDLGAGETALVTYFFKTSKYNSLEEKMEDAVYDSNDFEIFSTVLTLNTNEKFGYFDTKGLKEEDSTAGSALEEGTVIIEPLIRLFDPMLVQGRGLEFPAPAYTPYYKDHIDAELKLFIDRLEDKGVYFGTYPIPEISMDYSTPNSMHRQVVNYDQPLSESVIDLFSDVPQSDMVSQSGYYGAVAAALSIPGIGTDVEFEFTTFDKAIADAKKLYLWGEDIVADPYLLALVNELYDYTAFVKNHGDLYSYTKFGKYWDSGYTYYIDVYHGKFDPRLIKDFKGQSLQKVKFVH